MTTIRIDDEVQDAIRAGQPVVALESTIFSNLGLPSPANADALERSIAAVRATGAVPAVTAVLDGVARVGLTADEHHRILGPARKVAGRDIGVAIGQGWEVGATTVSAALALAARAGIDVFATGGIGGVHRGAGSTGDISADLEALARFPITTVCSGAKAFLDLPRTLEHLEMLGVPVLGWRSDELPAFTSVSSGLTVPHWVESASEVARIVAARAAVEADGGTLVTVSVPDADAIDDTDLEAATALALAAAEREGITGHAVTPFVLGQIAEITGGRSVRANLALAEQNASVAAAIATAITTLRETGSLD